MLIESVITAPNLNADAVKTQNPQPLAVEPPSNDQSSVRVAKNDSQPQSETNADAQELKEALERHDLALNFSRDTKSGDIVIRLIDQQTGETVRQIPSDVSLKLAEALVKFQGRFVNHFA